MNFAIFCRELWPAVETLPRATLPSVSEDCAEPNAERSRSAPRNLGATVNG